MMKAIQRIVFIALTISSLFKVVGKYAGQESTAGAYINEFLSTCQTKARIGHDHTHREYPKGFGMTRH
jgi:hypothetical protein